MTTSPPQTQELQRINFSTHHPAIMTVNLTELDAHEQPSDQMRAQWKAFSRKEPSELIEDPFVDDPRAPLEKSGFVAYSSLPKEQVARSFAELGPEYVKYAERDATIIHHPLLPGEFLA